MYEHQFSLNGRIILSLSLKGHKSIASELCEPFRSKHKNSKFQRRTMFHFKILSLSLSLLFVSTNASSSKPNIVFFLTDDQDQMLGGSFPTTGEATPVRKNIEKRKKRIGHKYTIAQA